MDLEVIWSDFAEKQLDDIFEYHEKMLKKNPATLLMKIK
jgi:plasmid stabilization system protein ParE